MLKFIYSTPINTMLTIIIAAILHVSAYWDSTTSSTVQWYQTSRTCLYWQPAGSRPIFVSCYERPNATYQIELGHVGPMSGDLRPTTGGSYILTNATETVFSPLIGRPQYFPLIAR